MLTKGRYAVLAVGVVALLANGCGKAKEMGKSLASLTVVREEIIKRFGEEDVNVNLKSFGNQSSLSITFINSPLNEKSSEDRVQRAQETAELVKSRYPKIASIDQVFVVFSRVRTTLGIFHSVTFLDIHRFDNNANQLPSFVSGPEGPPEVVSEWTAAEHLLAPRVSYSSQHNQTDIYLEGIQLEGTASKGLTMMPRLIVNGDTSKTTPRSPVYFHFDFASFSEKQKFSGLTKIIFVGDKLRYVTAGQFSTSRGNDGLMNEFLYLEVPYSMFRQLSDGKELTVEVGDRKYLLTVDQFQALRKMRGYVREQ